MTRRYVVPALLLTFLILLAVPALAQNHGNNSSYYDTFSEKWLDLAKWDITYSPFCDRTLECSRKIENGQLRLALRNFGMTDSDSGDHWSWTGLTPTNPNAIDSITTDVTLRSFSGTSCSTNLAGWTQARSEIGGLYFNTGTNDPADDVQAILYSIVDTNDPNTVQVGYYLGSTDLWIADEIGRYPIGKTLTATIAWDKANHQFIFAVNVTGDPSHAARAVAPYSVSDTTLPVQPVRWLVAGTNSLNCASAQTSAQVEVSYDNVMINAAPPQ
jgi:hypothetical protein